MIIGIVGTRDISPDEMKRLSKIIKQIVDIETQYEKSPTQIYSGNAEGVDQIANEYHNVINWLPWADYNKQHELIYTIDVGGNYYHDKVLEKLFPWFRRRPGLEKIIRRNAFIVLGDYKHKRIDLLIWYTGKGVKGGTSYAIKLARHMKIPDIEITKEALYEEELIIVEK